MYKKECGWEVIYIALVEFIKYILEIMWEYDSPATLYVCSKPYDQIYVNGTVYNDDISKICEGSVVVAVRGIHVMYADVMYPHAMYAHVMYARTLSLFTPSDA